MTLQNRVILYY